MASGAVVHLARKYGAVVFFPTFTAVSIFADWTHTRTWKRQLKEKAKAQELFKHQ